MIYEEAIEKAQKLLRLAKSDNPNEAALAASRAQEIMERFKIESLSVDYDATAKPEEAIKDFGFDPLDPEKYGKWSSWKFRLSSIIAKLNQCKVYATLDNRLALLGRPNDVGAVRYLYSWMVRETERLLQEWCQGCGPIYANNFRLGVIDTVEKKLEEQSKLTREAVVAEASGAGVNPLALVRVNNALAKIEKRIMEVEKYGEDVLKLRNRRRAQGVNYDGGARSAGRKAGESIRMTQARGAIGA